MANFGRRPARAASPARVLGLALVLLASMLPAPAVAADLASEHPVINAAPTDGTLAGRPVLDTREPADPEEGTAGNSGDDNNGASGVDLAGLPDSSGGGADGQPPGLGGGILPSVHYRDEAAHANEHFDFEPGETVTVPFSPRADDRWQVDGRAPRPLPPGHANGRQMRDAARDSIWSNGRPADLSIDRNVRSGRDAGIDQPIGVVAANADPASIVLTPETAGDVAAAPVGANGLRREIFGFLPYWELGDSSTTLDWRTLSTVAYFSVGCNANGTLQKKNSNGTLTTGWAGWTSSKMTSIINAAHQHRTRVVLTVSCFAWSSSGASIQASLLRSSSARATLARQIAAAVRDRGADGANLDFEPLVAGYADEFTALVRKIRRELNDVAPGYQLTFDGMGSIGNQPIAAATAPGGADAVFVMGYDYRTWSSSVAGSHSPLSGPIYDLTDTIRAYTSRTSPSKIILGVPYYGRAWSTSSNALHAKTLAAAKYGGSADPPYAQVVDIVAANGRRWDSVEQSPWTAYRKQTCTNQYGCVTSWRELYYDDAASLKLRYDLINRLGLRGAGIWALGYDNARSELRNAIADKFLSDRTAPVAGINTLPQTQRDEGFKVAWTAYDDSPIAGFDVDVSVNGSGWSRWLDDTNATSSIYLGTDGSAYAFRVRARDVHGNTSAWNSSINPRSLGVPGEITPGGFARVTTDGLRMRTSPTLGAAVMTQLPDGAALRVLGGPVSADGSTWFQVAGPVKQWGAVDAMQVGGWIAARGNGVKNAVPRRAVYATRIDAGITGVRLNGGGERALTPNGDGRQDALRVEWTNHGAFDSVALRIHRPDGTLAGSINVGATASGAHTYTWNGRLGGTLVPAGAYVVQVRGLRGSTAFSAPSASPGNAAQLARFGVIVGAAAPTSVASLTSSPGTPTRSANLTFTLRFGGSVRWLGPGDIVRSGSATGCSMGGPTGGPATYTITVAGCSAGTVTLTVKARTVMDAVSNWGPQANVSTTVRIDRSAPALGTPKATLRAGVALGSISNTTAVLANLAWSASDPGGAGIRDFDVRRSLDGAAFADFATDLPTPSMAVALAPGHTYRFAVRARDKAGNEGGWVAGPVLRPARVQDASSAIAFRGAWNAGASTHYSGESVRFAAAAGASAKLSFTGRGVAVVATRGPDRGAVKVYLDGRLVATVDTRAATLGFRSVVWSKTWASSGFHTIRLVTVGTSGRPRVDLDALDILR